MEMLLLVVGLTLAISGFCSLLEATLYSTRVPTLEAVRGEGGPRRTQAARFLEFKRNIAAPTSAILILNTIANTAGATLAGWLAARALGPHNVPLFSAAFTCGILFLAEILPKTYGATKWKGLWPWLSLPLHWLVSALRPAVWVTDRFSALFLSETGTVAVTEDEIRASIRLGARAGELTPDELQMLDAIFHFDDTLVREILVPRNEVVFCDLDAPRAAIAETLTQSRFTRYPACRGNLDTVVGMLHARDLVGVPIDEGTDLQALVREVLQVPETLSISQLLRQMQARQRHMAVVIDEHGSVSGIVTITEVLEQIVGAIRDELESPGEGVAIVREGDGQYRIRGNVALARINRELSLDLYDPANVTLSGLMVSKLGRLPQKGDGVDLEGASAEVLETRARRATLVRLRVSRVPRGSRGVVPEGEPPGSEAPGGELPGGESPEGG